MGGATITRKQVTNTYFYCDRPECGRRRYQSEQAALEHAATHLPQLTPIMVDGQRYYYLHSIDDINKMLQRLYHHTESRWKGPGWYSIYMNTIQTDIEYQERQLMAVQTKLLALRQLAMREP